MRTVNGLFDKITDIANLEMAVYKAAKGKKKKASVRNAVRTAKYHARKLREKLINGTWRPNSIHIAHTINDGINLKKREIVCPDFVNELVVSHAIMNIVKPVFMRRFYKYSCASVPGRGVEYALKHIRRSIKDYKNVKYHTVIDIHHFYDTVRPSKVFHQLRRIIRDKRTLMLFAHILRYNKVNSPTEGIIKRGMPIGFYSSQWLANVLLTKIDNLIKQNGIKHYYRYNDDMLLFSSNKRKLKKVVKLVLEELHNLKLREKKPPQIHRLSQVPIKYIGATIYPDKVILQKKVYLKACRVAKRIGMKRKPTLYDARKMLAYLARFKHFDTYRAYRKHIALYITKYKCAKLISRKEQKRNVD